MLIPYLIHAYFWTDSRTVRTALGEKLSILSVWIYYIISLRVSLWIYYIISLRVSLWIYII